MTYVMSDLHGFYDLYREMLEKINFSDDDTLYILGDIADRGDGPIDIYFDMMERKNIIPLLGNHDHRVRELTAKYRLGSIDDIMKLINEDKQMQTWAADGGMHTMLQYLTLTEEEKDRLSDYLESFRPCDVVKVGDNSFFLSHTAPNKAAMEDISGCEIYDFIWGEIEYGKRYFENGYLVTGHIPTAFFGNECRGKIFKINGHIDVDCGAFFTGTLGCLCLDTMEEFYVHTAERK